MQAANKIQKWRVIMYLMRAWLVTILMVIILASATFCFSLSMDFPLINALLGWLVILMIKIYKERIGLAVELNRVQAISTSVLPEFDYVKEKSRIKSQVLLFNYKSNIIQACSMHAWLSHSSVVIISDPILLFPSRELQGLFAHEFAHLKLRHLIGCTLLESLVSLFSFMLVGVLVTDLFIYYGKLELYLLLVVVFFVEIPPIIRLILNKGAISLLSRFDEYAADALGAYFLGSTDEMTACLQLLMKSCPDEYSKPSIFSTHPTFQQRIAALNKLSPKPI